MHVTQSHRSSACQASKKLDKAPKSEATAINNVKQKEDFFPGTFPDDEPNVALSPTEQADDSLIDESALLSGSSEPTSDIQIALDAQLSASSEEMADQEAIPQWAQLLIARVSALEKSIYTLNAREATLDTSSLGGTNFKSKGLAAHKYLRPYGKDEDAPNEDYDPRARESRILPEVFEGQKGEFEGWICTIIGTLRNNRYCYRDERARMTVVFHHVRGCARDLLMFRYTSEENPFVSAQEMLERLEVIFGNFQFATRHGR